MNSIERLMNYTASLPKEDPTHLESDPAEGIWPSRGEIVLHDIDAAYHSRPDKLVLRNANLTFNAGETVFIVGRTGSGKSTLLSLLLRLIESSNGTVEIDGRGKPIDLYYQLLISDHIFFARYQNSWCNNFAPWYSGDTPR
jgi:ATP-binding cassette subfamily C (CFTR/MRP) protein 1